MLSAVRLMTAALCPADESAEQCFHSLHRTSILNRHVRIHDAVLIKLRPDLFRRDQHICAYCGNRFLVGDLSRDHVQPVSKGGPNIWTNVVTACHSCNKYKDDRTPEQAGMELYYVPYTPNRAEWLILQNRKILADQMDFLIAKVPRESRLL